MYLVRRPKGKSKSETTSDKAIEALESRYGIVLDEMLKNIKDCNNQQLPDSDRNTIYVGGNRYADCYFTIGYVHSRGLDYPMVGPVNEDDLPDWVMGSIEDLWNGAREDFCSLPEHEDYPACDT